MKLRLREEFLRDSEKVRTSNIVEYRRENSFLNCSIHIGIVDRL